MTMYYVATLASYVLIEADSADEARRLGRLALAALRIDARQPFSPDVPIHVHTVRPASADEIELWNWHHDKLSQEKRQ